jgi:hypothetical protein
VSSQEDRAERAWDQETEDRIADALAVVNRSRVRILDHHPWEAPPGRMRPARFPWNARRFLLLSVAAALMLDLVAEAADHRGWARLGLVLCSLVILAATAAVDRRSG